MHSKYFTKYDDALSKDWNSQAFYMNPPFSQAGKWIEYAYNQHRKHKIDGLLLLAVRTDTIAWQTFILGIGHIHQNIWFLKIVKNILLNNFMMRKLKEEKNLNTHLFQILFLL